MLKVVHRDYVILWHHKLWFYSIVEYDGVLEISLQPSDNSSIIITYKLAGTAIDYVSILFYGYLISVSESAVIHHILNLFEAIAQYGKVIHESEIET